MEKYIDISDAMGRLGNNKKLYAMLLKKFDGIEMLEDLKNKLASGDIDGSKAQAHTIKGLAANLSLKDLREKAEAIELVLKNAEATDGADASEISESAAATQEAVETWLSENS